MDAFMRTGLLLGEGSLERLKGASVAVFGVGGVGGYVCEALARSGVGHLALFDSDCVSESNLNRQIIALRSTIGMPKVAAMRMRIADISPHTAVDCRQMFYLPENADSVDLTAYDYAVDCVDTVAAKMTLITRCRDAGTPLICAMGAGNKLDPSRLRVSDIYQTSVCPLARVIRAQCRRHGITALKVAWSAEEPRRVSVPGAQGGPVRRDTPSSAIFVPAAMGLLIASEVVRDLCEINREEHL